MITKWTIFSFLAENEAAKLLNDDDLLEMLAADLDDWLHKQCLLVDREIMRQIHRAISKTSKTLRTPDILESGQIADMLQDLGTAAELAS